MLKPCTQCSCSGVYVGWAGPSNSSMYPAYVCSCCKGKGWIEEDEQILVPRKFVKDEYWKQ
jgi:hypothetical protein